MFLIWLTFFTELVYGFMKMSEFGDSVYIYTYIYTYYRL